VTRFEPADPTAEAAPLAESNDEPSVSVAVGTVIRGRFELDSLIGEGGMGVVYRARDRLHEEMEDRDPYVAIKILNANVKRHPNALIALQRETRRAQTLTHENIINVHSFDRDGALAYMTMELLDGKTLRSIIAENASSGVPPAEAVPMIVGMAKALAYAHANDVVHCDFKPSNVFLTQRNQIKVLDFGVARAAPVRLRADDATIVDARQLSGLTPAYASPQMLADQEPVPSDDVFALAVVSFELLTGRHPFEQRPADETRLRALRASALPARLSRRRKRALLRALAPDRESRYGTAEEFLKDFETPRGGKTGTFVGVGAATAVPVLAFFLYDPNAGLKPAVPFEALAPEAQQEFNRAVDEGTTALTFGAAGINDALLYFSQAYDLHPNNPRAVTGLESVADRLLVSIPGADSAAQREVFDVLLCNAYLKNYGPAAAACDDALGTAECASIVASCRARPPE
jgi:hypothetical protein